MVLRIGHRGAMGYEPENTVRSFRKALELGCDMVELDIHACKTGELVVIHDPTLERTTNGKGPVRERTLDELRSLDAGKGERIPLLEEVLNLVQGKAAVNIELKGAVTARPLSRLIDRLCNEKGWSSETFLVSSFDHEELSAFRKLDPETPVGILFDENPPGLLEFALSLQAHSLHPSYRIVTPELVNAAHEQKIKVYAWTVDEPDDIEKMKRLNVDGIFSNFPDRI